MTVFECQTQPFCCALSLVDQLRPWCLGQVNHARVVSKVQLNELWMAVKSQRSYNQRLEMLRQKVGQVKRSQVSRFQRREVIHTSEKGIAVRPWQPFDTLLSQECIEGALGSTLGVCDEDLPVNGPRGLDQPRNGRRDTLRPVVKPSRNGANIESVDTVCVKDSLEFPDDGTAGDDQSGLWRSFSSVAAPMIFVSCLRFQPAANWLCLRIMKSFAVSTATAASRQ